MTSFKYTWIYLAYFVIMVIGPGVCSDGSNKKRSRFLRFPRIDLRIARRRWSFCFLGFPVFPHSAFAMATMIQFFMFSLYGMGWNTIGGYGGQVDLGKAQYVGIGAYTTTVVLLRWDIPFWFSMPIGTGLSVGWSFIIGYPALQAQRPLLRHRHHRHVPGAQGYL